MLTAQELKSSPLFHDISYEEYRRMLTCFQAAQRSYVPEEQVYDFTSSRTDAVGIVERGQVSLIRIDEAGVATVLEDMGPGGVFGRHLAFAGGQSGGGGPYRLRHSVHRQFLHIQTLRECLHPPQHVGLQYDEPAQQ